MRHRHRLQPIELVQLVANRQVRDEVVGILVLVLRAVLLEVEGVGAGERVVHFADLFRVADRPAARLRVEACAETEDNSVHASERKYGKRTFGEQLQVAELLAKLDVRVADVERRIQQSDTCASVVDDLVTRSRASASVGGNVRRFEGGKEAKGSREIVRTCRLLQLAVHLLRVAMPNPLEQENKREDRSADCELSIPTPTLSERVNGTYSRS